MVIKINDEVRLSNDYVPQNREEVKVYEDEANGYVSDFHAQDKGRVYVVFEGYGEDEGTDLGVWINKDLLDPII